MMKKQFHFLDFKKFSVIPTFSLKVQFDPI